MKTNDKSSLSRNVWIYCRVANNEDNSIEIQKRKLIQYAKEHGFNIVGLSQDIGNGLDYSRNGLAEIKQAVLLKNVEVVLVKDESRIGRDKFKNIAYIGEINALGVEFFSPIDGVIEYGFI